MGFGHERGAGQVRTPPAGRSARPRAVLALEDGTIFEGRSFGRAGEVTGEVVFSTALCGYQEVLTDPSYALTKSTFRELPSLQESRPKLISKGLHGKGSREGSSAIGDLLTFRNGPYNTVIV